MNAKRVNSAEAAAELVAGHERSADEEPIAYALTAKASCGRALSTGKPCPDHPHSEGPPLTVFRAEHDSIVMGLYTTAAAAREHCEVEERRSWAKFEHLTFDWIEDEEDGVAEMTAFVGGEEFETGYVVTALEVASRYDPDADE